MIQELVAQEEKLKETNKNLQDTSIRLTGEINKKKKELEDIEKHFEVQYKKLQDDFLRELKDVKQKIDQEDYDIVKMTQDQLEERLSELKESEAHIDKLEGLLRERQALLDEKDLAIARLTSDIQKLWSKLWQRSYNDIKDKVKSLEVKEQTLELITEENQDKRKILNDQIRSFKQAQKDLLKEQNG